MIDMKTNNLDKAFINDEQIPWEDVDKGVQRKIMSYDERLMLVKVKFLAGGIGTLHQHPHTQITYVKSGKFEIEINGEKQIMKGGDVYYILPGLVHGAVCLEDGMLIDAFSPMREDFIK